MEKQADLLIKQSLQTSDDEILTNKYQELIYKFKKVGGNSNTHKNRLKELKKNHDFK